MRKQRVPDSMAKAVMYMGGRGDRLPDSTRNAYGKAENILAGEKADQALLAFVITKVLGNDPYLRGMYGIHDIYRDWEQFNEPAVQRKMLKAVAMDDLWGDVVGFAKPFLGPLAEPIDWVGRKVGDWLGLSGEKRDISNHISDAISAPRMLVPD